MTEQPYTVAIDAPERQQDEALWEYADVATYLKVSESSVRRWVASGTVDIPFRKIGRGVRFVPSIVREWASRGEAA